MDMDGHGLGHPDSQYCKPGWPNPVLPYGGKFSRGPIFTVFTDDHLTVKIKAVK